VQQEVAGEIDNIYIFLVSIFFRMLCTKNYYGKNWCGSSIV